jgi:hypothetical protein
MDPLFASRRLVRNVASWGDMKPCMSAGRAPSIIRALNLVIVRCLANEEPTQNPASDEAGRNT